MKRGERKSRGQREKASVRVELGQREDTERAERKIKSNRRTLRRRIENQWKEKKKKKKKKKK